MRYQDQINEIVDGLFTGKQVAVVFPGFNDIRLNFHTFVYGAIKEKFRQLHPPFEAGSAILSDNKAADVIHFKDIDTDLEGDVYAFSSEPNRIMRAEGLEFDTIVSIDPDRWSKDTKIQVFRSKAKKHFILTTPNKIEEPPKECGRKSPSRFRADAAGSDPITYNFYDGGLVVERGLVSDFREVSERFAAFKTLRQRVAGAA